MAHGGTLLDFPGQESGESIFIFIRRYPLAFLPSAALILLMTLLGVVVIFLLGIGSILSYNIQILIGSVFLQFMLLFAIIEYFDFYFDLYIVTDRRIVDISQEKLFSRSVSELLLDDIEDVEAKETGFLETIVDYGDVEIQTAGARNNFFFRDILHPREVAAIILDLSGQARAGVAVADRHPEGPVAAIIDNKMMAHTPDHKNELPTNI